MRKFFGVLIGALGLAVKMILLFSLIIVGTDLINRHLEDTGNKSADNQ